MSEHTPEPWSVNGFGVWADRGRTDYLEGISLVAFTRSSSDGTDTEDQANAQRIAACVNACKGINPETVPDMLAALEQVRETALDMPLAAWVVVRAAIEKATSG